jgi:hypothetical protein
MPFAKTTTAWGGPRVNAWVRRATTRPKKRWDAHLKVRFAPDSPLEGAGFEPSVPRERNGEKAKEPVSLVERKVPEMSGTGRRLSIFTSGFSRD